MARAYVIEQVLGRDYLFNLQSSHAAVRRGSKARVLPEAVARRLGRKHSEIEHQSEAFISECQNLVGKRSRYGSNAYCVLQQKSRRESLNEPGLSDFGDCLPTSGARLVRSYLAHDITTHLA